MATTDPNYTDPNATGPYNTDPAQGTNTYNPVTSPVNPTTIQPYSFPGSPQQQATGVGGVSAVDPQAEAVDYNSLNQFSDAAWNQSMRYLDPQMEAQNKRYEQEMINKGLDPYSGAGQNAFRQKEMSQNDLKSKSAFDAMGFGAGMQQQMFGQDNERSKLSNNLLQSMMGLNQQAHEFDVTAGMQNNQQMYDQQMGQAGLDQRKHEFDSSFELDSNQQQFAQMLGLEGLDYRDYMTLIDQMRYDDSLSMALLGMGAPPSYNTVNTGMAQAPYSDYAGQIGQSNQKLYGG